MQYGLVRFEEGKSKRTTFDVVKTTCIVSSDEDGPKEGSQVEVRWRDKGLFQATLISISGKLECLLPTS